MKRYNKLEQRSLSVFASASGTWLEPMKVAQKLNFLPSRSAWSYFRRLWRFGPLERGAPTERARRSIASANKAWLGFDGSGQVDESLILAQYSHIK